jgi:hypothetical protein
MSGAINVIRKVSHLKKAMAHVLASNVLEILKLKTG